MHRDFLLKIWEKQRYEGDDDDDDRSAGEGDALVSGQFWTSCNINVRTMFSYNLKYYLPVSFSFPYKVSSIAFPYSTPGI